MSVLVKGYAKRFFGALSMFCLILGASQMALAGDKTPIRIVTDATFPPMEMMDGDTFTGFDMELIDAIAKKIGRPYDMVNVDFKGLIPSITSGRADVAISAIYITDARKKIVNFSKSYLAGGLVVVTKKDNEAINTPADLNGKKVSVQVGTKSVQWLKDHMPEAELVVVEKNQQMFNLVTIGRVDAAVTGKPAAYKFRNAHGGVKVLPDQLTTEAYGIAVDKNQPELVKAIDEAIDALKTDGTYATLVEKWFPAGK